MIEWTKITGTNIECGLINGWDVCSYSSFTRILVFMGSEHHDVEPDQAKAKADQLYLDWFMEAAKQTIEMCPDCGDRGFISRHGTAGAFIDGLEGSQPCPCRENAASWYNFKRIVEEG